MLREKDKVFRKFLAAADIVVAVVSMSIVYYLEIGSLWWIYDKDYLILNLLIVIIWYLLGQGMGINTILRSRPYSVVLFNCIGLAALGTTMLAISIYLFSLYHIGIFALFLFVLFDTLFTFLYKIIVYRNLKKTRRKGLNTLNVLVIGDQTAKSFLKRIIQHPEWGYRIVAHIAPQSTNIEFDDRIPILPENSNVEQLLRDKAIDEVILLKETTAQNEVQNLVAICSEMGVVFRMYSPFFNMLANKTHLHYFDTLPLLTVSSKSFNYLEVKIKRAFDVIFSLLVLIFLSPLFLAIALAIKFDSKGPVLFKQKRVGLRGRRFLVYKFRTMVANAEDLKCQLEEQNEMDGPVFKISNDPRITKVGRFLRKTSLDELPQFFNVLMGEMSVVGPRPPIPEEVKQYERWQLRRLSMKPGITCIWQVSGRNSIPFEEWMKMDMQYIDNWSLKLDFIIFLKTIRTVLRGDGQ